MQIGQVVISKQGRDKGLSFVVTDIQGEFLYLADGKLRKLHNPKRKNQKHIQATNYITGATYNKDSDLRNILKEWSCPEEVK